MLLVCTGTFFLVVEIGPDGKPHMLLASSWVFPVPDPVFQVLSGALPSPNDAISGW